jgi:hypothetical protein
MIVAGVALPFELPAPLDNQEGFHRVVIVHQYALSRSRRDIGKSKARSHMIDFGPDGVAERRKCFLAHRLGKTEHAIESAVAAIERHVG